MKKGLVLFFIFTIFFAGACSNTNAPAGTPKPTIIDLSDQYPDSSSEGVYIDQVAVSFEQMIDSATHIVKAECVQSISYGGSYDHTFKIQKQYKGKITDEQIHITVSCGAEICLDKGYSYTRDNQFYPGNTYVLLLMCDRSVYYERDKFSIKGDICIPVENVSEARMYNRSLREYSSLTQTQMKSFKEVEKYIIQQCATCTSEGYYAGIDYIRSEKLSDILNQSPYVLRVEVVSLKSEQIKEGIQYYKCNVVTEYKGGVPEEIYVIFFANTVTIGNQYIVAVTKTGPWEDRFRFSAKDSLISIDQEQEVLRILQSK